MFALAKKLREKQSGFTLIELLIVVIIIAVLAAIAIPIYMNVRSRAQVAAAMEELRNVGQALEIYYVDNDTYAAGTDWTTMSATLEEEAYMSNVPPDDPWGNIYAFIGGAITYSLTSLGSDGVAGGTSYAADIVYSDGAFIPPVVSP
jgi:general secretion pathway protein G